MSLHGSSHVTFDLDVVYERNEDNFQRIVAALAPLAPKLRGVADEVPFRLDERTLEMGMNFTLRTAAGDLDLLGHAPGAPEYSRLEQNSVEFDLDGRSILAASLDDLISMKTSAGRTKDQLHLLELRSLQELQSSGE